MWLVADFFIISGVLAWAFIIAFWLLSRNGHNIAPGW